MRKNQTKYHDYGYCQYDYDRPTLK